MFGFLSKERFMLRWCLVFLFSFLVAHNANCVSGRAGLRGATEAVAPGPHCKGTPRDDIYLLQIKYSFEKFL